MFWAPCELVPEVDVEIISLADCSFSSLKPWPVSATPTAYNLILVFSSIKCSESSVIILLLSSSLSKLFSEEEADAVVEVVEPTSRAYAAEVMSEVLRREILRPNISSSRWISSNGQIKGCTAPDGVNCT